MPSIEHEAVVELLRRNPRIPAILLAATGTGISISPYADAAIADSNLTVSEPDEFRPEMVTVFNGHEGKLAVVTEVQKDPPKPTKRWDWPAYLAIAARRHQCYAVLLVIALRAATARASSKTIRTGHPGFDLTPIVVGAGNTPISAGTGPDPELTVLAVLTGALDLRDHDACMLTLLVLNQLDSERRTAYTRLVHHTASAAVRLHLEKLMKTVFRDEFIDGYIDQGRAEGEARMLLRVIAARGFSLPDDIRERVASCTDIAQLEAWADRAAVATTLQEVFGD